MIVQKKAHNYHRYRFEKKSTYEVFEFLITSD